MAKPKQFKAARQGEVLIFRVVKKTWWGAEKPVEGNVIREGEKSGHKHEVKGDAQLKMFGDQMMIDVGAKGGEITHPEHGTIKLPKGQYQVDIQREFDGKERKAKD